MHVNTLLEIHLNYTQLCGIEEANYTWKRVT